MSEHTVLLVSPRRDLADPVRKAVRSLPARMLHVADTRDALGCLKAVPVSLLIADEDLPDGSGSELLSRVQVAAPSTARIILLDAASTADVAAEAVNEGRASWIIQKPFDETVQVGAILRQALTTHELEAQGRAAVKTLQHVALGQRTTADDRALQIERLCAAGEMAGSLIHRFNNTLSIIIGHLELLIVDTGSDEIKSRLAPVFQSVKDSAELTHNLQEFMRPSPAEKELLNLNALVSDTVRMTEPIYRKGSRFEGTVEVTTDLDDVPFIEGNAPEIREAMTNLVLNAIDAMPGGGKLRICTDASDGWARVTISDTGGGMTPEVQERIFEPFFTTKGQQGNGLGLCIVRRIVREHGGDIRIESTPGEGTRFIVLLPPATGMGAPASEWRPAESVEATP